MSSSSSATPAEAEAGGVRPSGSGGGFLSRYVGRIPRIVRRPVSLVRGVFFGGSKGPAATVAAGPVVSATTTAGKPRRLLPKLPSLPTLPFRGLFRVSKLRFFGRRFRKPKQQQQQQDLMGVGGAPLNQETVLPPTTGVEGTSHQAAGLQSALSEKQVLALYVPKNLHLTPLHHFDQLLQLQANPLPTQHLLPHRLPGKEQQQQQQNSDNGFKPDLHL